MVPRPRLVERLNAGLHRKLTLVSAPAGFGKTTLLGEWTANTERPFAWLSLDEGDNDPARFLAYFVAALQTVHESVGESVLAALKSPQPPPIDLFLTSLINEIAITSDLPSASAGRSFVLVLDDFHVITDPQVNRAMAFLLDNLPPQMHLVLSSRADPSWPLARLRARGEMTELRADDLRFTLEETTAFLNEAMRLDLSPEDVDALETRTEGWIAGLQMAALSMRGRKDVSAFIRAFSGSHRFVLDYLLEEVLEQQPRDVQEFLLKTSILERMTAPLCNAVTQSSDSRAILTQLDQTNLFLVPLDDERRWYRYHHLFADLLRQRLQQDRRDLTPVLHRRASEWYQAKELYPNAVNHSLAAGDEERAAELISSGGWDMLVRGEMRELLGWLDSLPQDLVSSRPQLGVIHAWALALTSQWERLDQRLTQIGDSHVPGEIAALQAYVASVQGNIPRTVALCKQASEALPERKWFSRSFVALSLGIAYFAGRQPAAARKAFCEAIELCRAAGFSYMMQAAMMELGLVQQMAGSLHEAAETFRRALELIPGQDLRPVPIAGMAYLGLSKAHYEWNDLDRALQNARRGIEVTDLGGFTNALLHSYVRLIAVHLARGDMMAASQAFEKAERLVEQHPHPAISGMLVNLRVRFWLRSGDLRAASLWLQEHPPTAGDVTNYPQELEQLAAARVLLGLKQTAGVLELLHPLQDRAEEAGRVWMLIRILVLQARALQVDEKRDLAVSKLERALSLAEPEGYVRTFVDEGEPMARLLRQALSEGIAPNYAARLLAAFGEEAELTSPAMESLIEPLTEREMDVLRLIVAGLSNPEIAEELFIAVSTVKSHINHIYGKLGVESRTQAVIKVQELALL
jgi:LuxR family maltose regulon positive regulatory protein